MRIPTIPKWLLNVDDWLFWELLHAVGEITNDSHIDVLSSFPIQKVRCSRKTFSYIYIYIHTSIYIYTHIYIYVCVCFFSKTPLQNIRPSPPSSHRRLQSWVVSTSSTAALPSCAWVWKGWAASPGRERRIHLRKSSENGSHNHTMASVTRTNKEMIEKCSGITRK